MADVVTVQLRFGVLTSLGLYQDTLSFSEDEWAKRDQKAIDDAKQALADTWVTFRSQQIADEQASATAQRLQNKITQIDQQIADLSAAKDVLVTDLAAMPLQPVALTVG